MPERTLGAVGSIGNEYIEIQHGELSVRDVMFHYQAQISIRRTLNRAHAALYSVEGQFLLGSSFHLSSQLTGPRSSQKGTERNVQGHLGRCRCSRALGPTYKLAQDIASQLAVARFRRPRCRDQHGKVEGQILRSSVHDHPSLPVLCHTSDAEQLR